MHILCLVCPTNFGAASPKQEPYDSVIRGMTQVEGVQAAMRLLEGRIKFWRFQRFWDVRL